MWNTQSIKSCDLIFREVGPGKDSSGESQYRNEHVDFNDLVVDHDGFSQ